MAKRTLPEQAYLRECFDYEPETGRLMWRRRPLHHFVSEIYWRRWNTTWAGKRAGSISRGKYWEIRLSGQYGRRKFYVHRLIYKMETGKEPNLVDHEDCHGLDNRRDNIRHADYAGNSQNRRQERNKRSGLPKGVSYNGPNYKAQIRFAGKRRHLGTFKTPEEAYAIYCAAVLEHHGEFANLGLETT